MKFLLFASIFAAASAVFENDGGRPLRGQRRLPDGMKGGSKSGSSSGSSSSSSDDGDCDVRSFMFFADRTLVAPRYKSTSAEPGTAPQPGDTEQFHFPIFDYEAFADNGSEILIGYAVETLIYVPLADFEEPECAGNWIFTFKSTGGDFEGQLTSDFTCFLGFDITAITGGLGKYLGASGYIQSTFKSPGFFEGDGFSVWEIVSCRNNIY